LIHNPLPPLFCGCHLRLVTAVDLLTFTTAFTVTPFCCRLFPATARLVRGCGLRYRCTLPRSSCLPRSPTATVHGFIPRWTFCRFSPRSYAAVAFRTVHGLIAHDALLLHGLTRNTLPFRVAFIVTPCCLVTLPRILPTCVLRCCGATFTTTSHVCRYTLRWFATRRLCCLDSRDLRYTHLYVPRGYWIYITLPALLVIRPRALPAHLPLPTNTTFSRCRVYHRLRDVAYPFAVGLLLTVHCYLYTDYRLRLPHAPHNGLQYRLTVLPWLTTFCLYRYGYYGYIAHYVNIYALFGCYAVATVLPAPHGYDTTYYCCTVLPLRLTFTIYHTVWIIAAFTAACFLPARCTPHCPRCVTCGWLLITDSTCLRIYYAFAAVTFVGY